MSNVEHSIPVVSGTRAIARKNGIEVWRDSEEVLCFLTWAQIDHLRTRVLDQR